MDGTNDNLVKVHVALAKRRTKKIAGGIVSENNDPGDIGFPPWWFNCYGIVNDVMAPIWGQGFASRAEALEHAQETLMVKPGDWHEMTEIEAEQFILDHAKNRWTIG